VDGQGTSTEGSSQLLNVACNHCGAPLSVPGEARFVTCTYCGASLQVLRSGGAAYTQVLNNIDERTQRIEQDVAELKTRERIDELDRQWMLEREQYLVRGRNGNSSIPSPAVAIFGSAVAAVFGIIWTCVAVSIGAPGLFPLFGVVFVLAALVGGGFAASKASEYKNAQEQYQRRRQALQDDLDRQ
jgi:ribosomal protein S27E